MVGVKVIRCFIFYLTDNLKNLGLLFEFLEGLVKHNLDQQILQPTTCSNLLADNQLPVSGRNSCFFFVITRNLICNLIKQPEWPIMYVCIYVVLAVVNFLVEQKLLFRLPTIVERCSCRSRTDQKEAVFKNISVMSVRHHFVCIVLQDY